MNIRIILLQVLFNCFKFCSKVVRVFFHVFFLPSRFAFMFASSQSQKLWHDLRASPGSQKACHHACWPITIFHLETRQSLSIVYNGLKMLVNSHSPGFVRPRLSKDIMLLQIRQSLCVACRRNCSMFVETESNVLDSGSVLERGPLFSWHKTTTEWSTHVGGTKWKHMQMLQELNTPPQITFWSLWKRVICNPISPMGLVMERSYA